MMYPATSADEAESVIDADAPVVVKAPLSHRLTRHVVMLLAIVVAPLLGMLLVRVLGRTTPASPALLEGLTIGVGIACAILAPTAVAYGFPGRMALHTNRLRLGGRLIGRWIDYDRVHVLDLNAVNSKRVSLTLDLGITRPKIMLRRTDADQVVPALQTFCPQAALWDEDGSIQLADDPRCRRESGVAVRSLIQRRAAISAAIGAITCFGGLVSLASAVTSASAVRPGVVGPVVAILVGIGMLRRAFVTWRTGGAVTEILDELDEIDELDVALIADATVERDPFSAG